VFEKRADVTAVVASGQDSFAIKGAYLLAFEEDEAAPLPQ